MTDPNAQSALKASLQQRTILLVDDNRLFIATMTKELEAAGYQVINAGSVGKAEVWLEMDPRPDLVVLDVHMPGRSGLDLAQRLNELDHIPFILLTAYSEKDIIEQANKLGAMSYLVKPVDSVQLIPAIETALSRANDLQTLQRSQQQLQTVINSNREVNIAIGITMINYQRVRNAAFELLRGTARNQNRKLASVATDVINESETIIRKNSQETR